MALIIFILSMALNFGCTAQSEMPMSQAWYEDRHMTRLEREVQQICDELVKNVTPGSLCLTWSDNLHPHAPMMAEAYIVSMFERNLIRKGFTLITDEEVAKYNLMLTMTPSRKSLLTLASLRQRDTLLATKEYHFINGSEQWNKALCSYRYKTSTVIHVGSRP